jgi:hypothetical protein
VIEEDVFHTKTMAKVYADQGKLGQAVAIYRHLLKKDPDRQDLMEALAEIEKKRFEKGAEGLGNLFSTWLELLLANARLQKLEKLQRQLEKK